MAEFKLTIADELLPTIKDLGYDVDSYFDEAFTKPLLERHRQSLEQAALEEVKVEIDQKVAEVKDSISLTIQEKEITPVEEEPPLQEKN